MLTLFIFRREAILGEGRVRVWHFESAKMVCEGIGHSRAISAMQFSPDDKQLVSVGVDGSVLLWNVYV